MTRLFAVIHIKKRLNSLNKKTNQDSLDKQRQHTMLTSLALAS